jgi:hypothetical protein
LDCQLANGNHNHPFQFLTLSALSETDIKKTRLVNWLFNCCMTKTVSYAAQADYCVKRASECMLKPSRHLRCMCASYVPAVAAHIWLHYTTCSSGITGGLAYQAYNMCLLQPCFCCQHLPTHTKTHISHKHNNVHAPPSWVPKASSQQPAADSSKPTMLDVYSAHTGYNTQ